MNLVIVACIFLALLSGMNAFLLRFLHPGWWRNKILRATAALLPLLGIASAVSWASGYSYNLHILESMGAVVTPTIFILEFALLASLPLSGAIYSVARLAELIGSFRHRNDRAFIPDRRLFLKAAAGVFPAAAVTSSLAGVTDSFAEIIVPIRHIPVAGLPRSLEGFKIAHLSDSHLGYYIHLEGVIRAVEKIAPHDPDLVLYTGDISDDLDILPETLRIVNRLKPRYGIYASVGNHEYYRGIKRVLEIFARAPFPMLIEHHVNIEVGDTTIFLGGANDPQTLSKDYTQFLTSTIESTMDSAPPDAFKLLMCHRPEGFNHAADKGINLVLSGHTHGGQLGVGGRSAFEPIFPGKYLWGVYRRGNTTLFTSGGMGHWFPFRLGVPAEAPILVLEKA